MQSCHRYLNASSIYPRDRPVKLATDASEAKARQMAQAHSLADKTSGESEVAPGTLAPGTLAHGTLAVAGSEEDATVDTR